MDRSPGALKAAVTILFWGGISVAVPASSFAQDGTSFTARDSAGVEIVSSTAPLFQAGSWRLDANPVLSCSSTGPNGDDRIFEVRSIVPIEENRLAILVEFTRQVLICERDRIVAAYGRQGEGPGEFSYVREMVPAAGDSVAVLSRGKLTVFSTSTGEFRDVPELRLLGDGYMSLRGAVDRIAALPLRSSDGVPGNPEMHRVKILGWDGTEEATLDVQLHEAGAIRMWWALWPEVGAFSYAVAPDGYWMHPEGSGEIRKYTGPGLSRIVRAPWSPRPMTDEMKLLGVETYIASSVASDGPSSEPAARRLYMRFLERDTSSTLPYLTRILPTVDGELWARIPEERIGEDPPVWRVFNRDGVWLQDLTLPPRFTLMYVEGDRLYGVRKGELDLETVEVLILDRGGGL